ncbi:MAG: HAD family hydrolase, partial [Clostridia bacterium]|nr:HAD family hydrolase [Clostridia bacterium]
MKYELVIFDLDGTLLDTVEDLRAALNYGLAQAGFPTKTRDEMKLIIGG